MLKLCVVHDLGEAIGGDVPAVAQPPTAARANASAPICFVWPAAFHPACKPNSSHSGRSTSSRLHGRHESSRPSTRLRRSFSTIRAQTRRISTTRSTHRREQVHERASRHRAVASARRCRYAIKCRTSVPRGRRMRVNPESSGGARGAPRGACTFCIVVDGPQRRAAARCAVRALICRVVDAMIPEFGRPSRTS